MRSWKMRTLSLLQSWRPRWERLCNSNNKLKMRRLITKLSLKQSKQNFKSIWWTSSRRARSCYCKLTNAWNKKKMRSVLCQSNLKASKHKPLKWHANSSKPQIRRVKPSLNLSKSMHSFEKSRSGWTKSKMCLGIRIRPLQLLKKSKSN